MSSIAKWIAANSGTLADATAMASRSSGYYNVCQVSAADIVIDNSINLDKYLSVEVLLGSYTPAVTDIFELYILYAMGGTNYEAGSSSYLPSLNHLWASEAVSTDTSAAAKRFVLNGRIRPFKFKMLWRWRGTNATAASGSAMTWQTYNDNLNG